LVQKYFVTPIGGLLSYPNTSRADSGIAVDKLNASGSKVNVVDMQHKNNYENGISPPIDLRPIAAQN
jgi:hypothetical protein